MAGLSFYGALGVDLAIWVVWSLVVSAWAVRWPPEAVQADGWLTRLRSWERDGLAYTTVGVRRWKGRLPNLGAIVGGRALRLPERRDPLAWRRMAGETRRAERAHWLILLALPMEWAVRGGVILLPMVAYALVANGPCIVAQRYNRGRLVALGRRRLGRSQPAPAVGPA